MITRFLLIRSHVKHRVFCVMIHHNDKPIARRDLDRLLTDAYTLDAIHANDAGHVTDIIYKTLKDKIPQTIHIKFTPGGLKAA